MTYIGVFMPNPNKEGLSLKNFIIVPTLKITEDKRVPEVVIAEEYANRNKGKIIKLNLENKISNFEIPK